MIMRKKIKLPLEMADGVKVRTLDELKDNWSLEKVVENYLNGRLATWLNDRYYTELAEQVDALAEVQDNTALQKELCKIFDVDFADEEDIDVDAVNERNRKLDILRQHTDDDTVLKNVDIVAFDQEELGDILDSGENVIYLFNNTFSIPLSIKNKKYIGIGKAECLIHSKDVVDFAELGIEFENVVFDEKYRKIEEEESPSKFYNDGCKYFEAKQYKEALECFEKAASKNHAGALFHVGKIYDLALGVEQDYRLAAEYYSKAVSFNSGKAANNLANMFLNGYGVEKNEKKAVELYKKGAEWGSGAAAYNLAGIYKTGDGLDQNYNKAIEFYKKAIDAGNGAAADDLGNMYFYGEGVEKNYDEALKYFRKGAELGNCVATGNVGHCYRWGDGVAQDYVEAMKWLKKSSDMGSSWAMNVLGDMYLNGEGVDENNEEAMKWYRKGAEAGDNDAIANVGYMYCYGKGVEQNYEEAMKWCKKAADGGNAWAMSKIGDLYYNGNGVTENYEEAVSWYKKASEQNRGYAFYMLGWCYEFGQGVSKDYSVALDNYKKAVENGNYSSSYEWDPTYRAARLMYKEFNERTKAREYIGSHYDGNKMKAFLDKIIENVKSLSIYYSGFVKGSFNASFTVSGEREAKLELFKAAERELREFKSNIANGANEKVNNFTNELRDITDIIDWVYELNLDGKYNQYINESIRSCLNSLPVPDAEDLCYGCEQTNDSLYNRGSFFSPEYWYCYQYTGYDFTRKCFDTVDSQLKAMCDEIKKDLLNICNELKASYK